MKSDNDSQTAPGAGFAPRRRRMRPPFPPAFAAGRPGFGGGFGHGFGPRGGPFGPRGRARRGDVRLAILSLLVDEGLVSGAQGGDYALTDAGHGYVAEHAEELAAVWQVGPKVSGEQAALIEATRKLVGAIRQVGTDGSANKQAAAAEKVDALRKELYRLLGE